MEKRRRIIGIRKNLRTPYKKIILMKIKCYEVSLQFELFYYLLYTNKYITSLIFT